MGGRQERTNKRGEDGGRSRADLGINGRSSEQRFGDHMLSLAHHELPLSSAHS